MHGIVVSGTLISGSSVKGFLVIILSENNTGVGYAVATRHPNRHVVNVTVFYFFNLDRQRLKQSSIYIFVYAINGTSELPNSMSVDTGKVIKKSSFQCHDSGE